MNKSKHKINLYKTTQRIKRNDFILEFMIRGLTKKSIVMIPRIYNLVMLIKLYLIFACLLTLQSASFAQSLLFTMLELSYLFFIIYYQTTTKALISKTVLVIRMMESITLTLVGVVCTLYSLREDITDDIAKYISYPTFFIFIITMVMQYCNLVVTLLLLIKNLITSGQKKQKDGIRGEKNKDKEISALSLQQEFDQAMSDTPRGQNKPKEKESFLYWKNHPFVVLETLEEKRRNFRRSIRYIPRKNRKRLRRNQLSQKCKRVPPRSGLEPKSDLHPHGRERIESQNRMRLAYY